MRLEPRSLALATVLLIAAPAVSLAEIGPYFGASAGEVALDLDLRDVDTAGFRIEDEDFAYKVFIGFELPGPFAVEAGSRDLGSLSEDLGPLSATVETQALDAAALAKLGIGPVSFFVKAGVVAWDAEVHVHNSPVLPDLDDSDDGTDSYWGVGVSVEIGRFGVRGEYESFEIDLVDDLTMLSVGVTVEF
jgi:hypothetical protein